MKICLSFKLVDIDVDKDNQNALSPGHETGRHCSK